MTTSLWLILLLVIAFIYGIFFVIFKVGFLLFKNKRNFWPLILSGVVTFGLVLCMAIATYHIYLQYTKPFVPIMTALKETKQPIVGTKTYTDPKYGFSLTLYDGMTLTDWMALSKPYYLDLLMGVDINNILQSQSKNLNNFEILLLAHNTSNDPRTPQELLIPLKEQIQKEASVPVQVTFQPDMIQVPVGSTTTGSMLVGQIYSPQLPQPMPFALLAVSADSHQYYVLSIGKKHTQETVSSFRLN